MSKAKRIIIYRYKRKGIGLWGEKGCSTKSDTLLWTAYQLKQLYHIYPPCFYLLGWGNSWLTPDTTQTQSLLETPFGIYILVENEMSEKCHLLTEQKECLCLFSKVSALQRYEIQMKKPQLSPKDFLCIGYLGKIWKNKGWIGEIFRGLVAQKATFGRKFTWF